MLQSRPLRDPSILRMRGVYAITPDDPDTARLVQRVGVVLSAGACLLQYRNKAASTALRLEQAIALRALCESASVPLIINDDVELAAAVGADGVHLGEGDGDPAHARGVLKDGAIIGVSCYDDAQRATHAVLQGAHYVAFGALFASPSKPLARQASLSLLSAPLPAGVLRVAIGGITPANAREVVAAGADLVAVITGVFDAPDPVEAVHAYAACFRH